MSLDVLYWSHTFYAQDVWNFTAYNIIFSNVELCSIKVYCATVNISVANSNGLPQLELFRPKCNPL